MFFRDPNECLSSSWLKLSCARTKMKLIKSGRLMFILYNWVPLHIFLGCCAEPCELALCRADMSSQGLLSEALCCERAAKLLLDLS